ncbi:AI-2E family transporter [Amedibacillus dolichus]|uniref:AI-2E family transporter n=1 Tax=Amedibacillus dolichus TaxID=31971 RepID=UPI00242B755C|nr:AI-2E family transporter [Amedibacillus dolichus]
MRFKMTDEIHKKVWMYSIIVAVGILLYFALYRFQQLASFFSSFFSLLMPFILGFAIAFILNGPMMFFEAKLFGKLRCSKQVKRNLSALLSLVLFIAIVCFLLALLIPQLVESIASLVKSFPGYAADFQVFAIDFMKEHDINVEIINKFISDYNIVGKLTEFVTSALPQMAKLTYQLGSTLLNVLLGIISGLYMMMDKERLLRYFKKLNYAVFPKNVAEYTHRLMLSSSQIFNNFIIGKAIDSLIIGILCYVGSVLLGFPYAILLSVVVGVTNMIPVFGPFIGAIPGVVLLFIIHPITAVYYALFILVLQQFDGNILGPLILGDKLGLPSIGILFSVVIGGGLFNVVGMFIGVPCFAVIYMAVREWTHYRLEKRQVDLEASSQSVHDAMHIEMVD